MRSSDAGASWTDPSPVLPDSATDGSRDLFPSVATDFTGRWLVTFTSYRPLKGPGDMDAANALTLIRFDAALGAWVEVP